jgi:hypothetical protein
MTREPCKTCGVELVWLLHERTGKPAPIEAAPNAKGNIVPLVEDGPDEFLAVVIEKATHYRALGKRGLELWREQATAPALWLNHYATCKDAGLWHERSKAKKPEMRVLSEEDVTYTEDSFLPKAEPKP